MPAKRTDVDLDYLAQLYQAGQSENAIAQQLGLSRPLVRRCLLEAGIARRGRQEAELLKWQQMPPAQRARQVSAAHTASRGRTTPLEQQVRAANGRHQARRASALEIQMAGYLGQAGVIVDPQAPCGPYNIDLAVPPVAVEIFGGNWHASGRHLARANQRTRYLLDRGWHLLVIWVRRSEHPLGIGAADYVIAWLEELRRQPPLRCEYRMIWGDGEYISRGDTDDEDITLVPPFRSGRDPTTGRYVRVT